MSRKTTLFYAADISLVTLSFLLLIWAKPASLRVYLPQYFEPFVIFLCIWLVASIPTKKYSVKGKESFNDFMVPVVLSGFITLGVVCILIVGYNRFAYSRMIVFGTLALSGFLEILLFSLYYYYRKLNRSSDNFESVMFYLKQLETQPTSTSYVSLFESDHEEDYPVHNLLHYREFLLEQTSEPVYQFICRHVEEINDRTLVLSTTSHFVVEMTSGLSKVIINLQPTNDIKRVNKFFEMVNTKLDVGGLFIGCVITNEIRKANIFRKYPWAIKHIIYSIYFIFKRIFPKLPLLKKIYFFMTNGFDRPMSKAEAIGRLYCCGFEVLENQQFSDRLFFVAHKTTEPTFDLKPTYGPLISLKRIGKNGKIIHVYKLRTMHPYAEYIQEYVFAKNQLQEGGKFKDDFRISTSGRILRKLWIDELPMLFNMLMGDLKLVGVRPLSRHYFNLYSKELQERRMKHRPGLVPPFYADMPVTLDEIMASELKYLAAYEKHPFRTDWIYFGKAFNNILIKRKRSN
ncbi:UDP-N-acetylgalactosaminyltransferase [Aquipluma nitroreducens]|uniref:UDP-N-acetylgalactosaminyltransferase n=1 Tax=Aquipluma nitroreducens TaxID=2010828 RepID=A0A5K7S436_9BACT|nr:sugar transferase [Aquipluma nitroreducens]BBE16235.1 UDP-N-acetylgalactosaminyltransferase [Aquipluma nitroreducens]